MKNKKQKEQKLSFKKMQIAKINNLASIKGGNDESKDLKATCQYPENGSNPKETIFTTTV